MDGIWNTLSGKRQIKAGFHLSGFNFRKSSESSRGGSKDIDSAEARRKAAAWAWHQRGEGVVYPVRKTTGLRESAVHGDYIVDRPMSRFKMEATSSIPIQSRETSLLDASELSSIAERVQLLVQKLKIEGSSESPSPHRDGTAYIKRNENAFDASSTSDRLESRTAQSHQLPSERENVLDFRSLSDLPYSRQVHQQPSEEIRVYNGDVHGNVIIRKQRKSSNFRRPLSVVRRLFQGSSTGCSNPCSELSTQAQIHHHYYHHHHFYHHHISGEGLQTPDINAKAGRPRRNSETFAVHARGGSEEDEIGRERRHSSDVGGQYRFGDNAWDVADNFDQREMKMPSTMLQREC